MSFVKRIISMILALVLVIGMVPAVAASHSTDPSNGLLAPDDELTRGWFFYALWNFFGSPEPAPHGNTFTDLNESDYWYDAAYWAVENGITTGMTDTKFNPDAFMNRAQAATCLWRAAGYPDAPARNPFVDVGNTSFFCISALWAAAQGCMEPLEPDKFGPYEKCLYGHINWNFQIHTHEYTATVTDPTCTLQGYTTYACPCSYDYRDNYTDALGHDYAEGTCTRCGEADPDHQAGRIPSDPSYGKFSPDETLTRGKFFYTLWNYHGSPLPEYTQIPFTDISKSDYYYDAICWAIENGIAIGINETEFGPTMEMNKSQAALFMWRAAGSPDPVAEYPPYTDVDLDKWYTDAVIWVWEEGYMIPTSETVFGVYELCPYNHINWLTDAIEREFNGLTYVVFPYSVDIIGYSGTATELVIPAELDGLPVARICDLAFSRCSSLTSVLIPDSVRSIGKATFSYCENLTDINIPDNLTYIGDAAFHGCSSLSGIVIPDSVTAIYDYTFEECTSLSNIDIPDGITAIGNRAFYNCDSLTSIQLPDSVTSIGYEAFYDCDSLTSIDLPDGITGIERFTFEHCDNLLSVDLPDSLNYILVDAFSYCFSLTNIVIPASVTFIDEDAFSSCFSLNGIHVDENNPNYSSDDRGVLFDKEKTRLIQAPGAIQGSYTVPSGVTSIVNHAFYCCDDLISIEIPGSVTYIGYWAFFTCTGLSSIRFVGDPPEFDSSAFAALATTAYYPADNPTWTEDVMQDYGGKITWVPYTPNPFTDVPAGAFYEIPVLWAVENGITTGATENSFDPNGTCLRAHVVTFLWRAEGKPEPAHTDSNFTDVKSSDFFYKPVLWAVAKGITNGISATQFGSYGVCNRAAVVTFLWRAAGQPEPSSTDNPFVDVKESDFFYKAVLWAVENEITNGINATDFGPTASCNRAQVVTFLYRAYN